MHWHADACSAFCVAWSEPDPRPTPNLGVCSHFWGDVTHGHSQAMCLKCLANPLQRYWRPAKPRETVLFPGPGEQNI